MAWLTAGLGPDAGDVPLGTLLDGATQRAVADLNSRYLALCLGPRSRPDQRFDLAEAIATRFGLAGPVVLERVAACPFTLFDLRLMDAIAGLPAAAAEPTSDAPATAMPGHDSVRERAPGYPLDTQDPRVPLFLQQVLFLAWHLAATAPMACRLALGFSPSAEQALRGLSPGSLGDLCCAPQLLRPRWPYNLRFWSTVLDAALAQSAAQTRRGHCLGIQLLAADLHGRLPADPPRTRAR